MFRTGLYDQNVVEGVSILPSNVNLAAAEIELIGVDRKDFILKMKLTTFVIPLILF